MLSWLCDSFCRGRTKNARRLAERLVLNAASDTGQVRRQDPGLEPIWDPAVTGGQIPDVRNVGEVEAVAGVGAVIERIKERLAVAGNDADRRRPEGPGEQTTRPTITWALVVGGRAILYADHRIGGPRGRTGHCFIRMGPSRDAWQLASNGGRDRFRGGTSVWSCLPSDRLVVVFPSSYEGQDEETRTTVSAQRLARRRSAPRTCRSPDPRAPRPAPIAGRRGRTAAAAGRHRRPARQTDGETAGRLNAPARVSRIRLSTCFARSGKWVLQPVLEHLAQLVRQAQQHIAGVPRAGAGSGVQDLLHLRVVQAGDHRRGQHTGRHAGAGQLGDRVQPAAGRGRARLHAPGQRARPAWSRRATRAPARRFAIAQDVQIAQHAGGFRHDADRVVEPVQHLPAPARVSFRGALHRLIRVGVGAQCARVRAT